MATYQINFFQYALGLTCMLGEVYLIVRGLMLKLHFEYIAFYLYLTVILLRDALSFYMVFHDVTWRSLYNFYYGAELLIYVLGFATIFEIYRRVFDPFPAIRRFFQLLFVLSFTSLLAMAMVKFPFGNKWWTMMMFDFEKNIRFVGALLLILIVGLVEYYRVPINRNLHGILFGLTFYYVAAISLATTFAFFGPTIAPTWQMLSVIAFLVAEILWVAQLSSVAMPIALERQKDESWNYGSVMPQLARGLQRLNAQLSPWMNK